MSIVERFSYLYMLRASWRLADAGQRRMMLGFYLLSILANCVGLIEPLILARIVQSITAGGPEVLHQLAIWSAVWLGWIIVFWALHGPSRVVERRLSFALRQRLTERLYTGITSQSWAWHQNHHSGALLNRTNFAAQAIYDFADNQFMFVQFGLRMVGSIAILLWIAPGAGLTMAVSLPLLSLLLSRFDKALARLSQQQNRAEHATAASLSDYLGNIGTVLTLRLQQASRGEILRRLSGVGVPLGRAVYMNEGKWCLYGILLRIIQSLSLIGFIWRHREGDPAVMAGTAVAILQYLQQISSTFFGTANLFQMLIKSRASLSEAGLGSEEAAASTGGRISPDWTRVDVRQVGFRYQDAEHRPHTLAQVDLILERGKRVALVGASGSGKSTLLRLLRGLHEADTGTLSIDGGAPLAVEALSDISTLVPQDPEIFENTIRYNVTCGLVEDEATVAAALHTAVLQPVIDGLAQGLDTDIRERGVNLSGGQKQRLALARGVLAARNSSLILLDEPTSSLDAVTEAQIFDRLFTTRPDACIVASIHRLHLLDRFDHVYVMEAGRVVEQGSLAELLVVGGVLAGLCKAQEVEAASA